MAEQEMRMKVVNGLECCSVSSDKRDCDLCSIGFGEGCALKLKRDALVLLKAEKPNCAAANRDAGGCLGYCHSKSDDESIDICKGCKEYTGNREGW